MAEKSGFFNSVNGDRRYKADFFAEYFASFIGNGVFPNPSTSLQVIANNNMTVTLKAGKAWINGYYYCNDADLVLTLENADGVLNRIDKLVLQFNTVNRIIAAQIKKGSFATSPVAPTLQRDANGYELGLADIYVGKGVLSITQANITDLRLDNTKCGVVHGTIDQVDTTTLFNQYQTWLTEKKALYDADMTNWTAQKKADYESWYDTTIAAEQGQIDSIEAQFQNDFNSWFTGIKNILDGDAIGNLTNKINSIPKVYKGAVEPTAAANIDIWLKELSDNDIQITQRNSEGTAWDDVFPKTIASNVITNDGINVEDKLVQIPTFQTAQGTANAITLTDLPLINGYSKTFIVSGNNNGAATTVNGKSLYKPNTTTAPTLTQGKAVTIWYSSGSNAFFIKASAEGNTVAGHVLAGDTFSNDTDTGLVGTMPNRGAINQALAINGSYTIPAGYHNGSGVVNQSVATKGAATITPSTVNQTIAANQYLTGVQTILGDANLIASNIKSGASIFGVAGTVRPLQYATGTSQYSQFVGSQYNSAGWDKYYGSINLNAFPFVPDVLIIKNSANYGGVQSIYYNNNGTYIQLIYYGCATHSGAFAEALFHTFASGDYGGMIFLYHAQSTPVALTTAFEWIAMKY